jgi:hypothetical protein
MTRIKLFIFGIILVFSAIFQVTLGQSLEGIKLQTKLSVLNGKAFFNFPNGTKKLPINEIADPNTNEATLLGFDSGKSKLSFYARELHKRGDSNLFVEVFNVNKELNYRTKILTHKDQLLTILSTPTVFDTIDGSHILLNILTVKTQDNSVFEISAWITIEALLQRDDFINLTERVFKTITKGTREYNNTSRTETFKFPGASRKFTVNIPENYGFTLEQFKGNQIFRFTKYRNYSDTNWAKLEIHTGVNLMVSDWKRGYIKDVRGKFLGDAVHYTLGYVPEAKTYYKASRFLTFKARKNGEKLDCNIRMYSNQEGSIEDLTKIVESFTQAKKVKSITQKSSENQKINREIWWNWEKSKFMFAMRTSVGIQKSFFTEIGPSLMYYNKDNNNDLFLAITPAYVWVSPNKYGVKLCLEGGNIFLVGMDLSMYFDDKTHEDLRVITAKIGIGPPHLRLYYGYNTFAGGSFSNISTNQLSLVFNLPVKYFN